MLQKQIYYVTTATEAILKWGKNKFIKMIPLGKKDNVAAMYSSPGYNRFQALCSEADISVNDEDNVIICDKYTSTLEDKDGESTPNDSSIELTKHESFHNKHFQNENENENENDHNITTQLNLQKKMDNDSLDLLNLHEKYGHIPFARLR